MHGFILNHLWNRVIDALSDAYGARNARNTAKHIGTEYAICDDDESMCWASESDCFAWCDDLESRLDLDVSEMRAAMVAFWLAMAGDDADDEELRIALDEVASEDAEFVRLMNVYSNTDALDRVPTLREVRIHAQREAQGMPNAASVARDIIANRRERATVLAALRFWQRLNLRALHSGVNLDGLPEWGIANDACECLTPEEIDSLCERVNV
jgi:hypothetical protein